MQPLFLIVFFLLLSVMASGMAAPPLPTEPDSAMYSLEDLYNRLNSGAEGIKRTGPFTEPAKTPPSTTGHTLDDIMIKAPVADNAHGATAADVVCGKIFWGLRTDGTWGEQKGGVAGCTPLPPPAPSFQTGQTISQVARDDGALQVGVVWPTPRFTDNGDGTVTDNLTSLVWMKNGNCFGDQSWDNALAKVAGLNAATQSCTGYSAGSHKDWRLPNRRELRSLIDYGKVGLALPLGHPFSGVQTYNYWSGTTYAGDTTYAWRVGLSYGYVNYGGKADAFYVWPVRGGQ